MNKFVGIDYGTKRIGIAVSDDRGEMAFPRVIANGEQEALREIEKIRDEGSLSGIVIGESKNYKQEPNELMRYINLFKEKVEANFGLPVYLHTEFLTTRQAVQTQEKVSGTDSSAATILLQSFIDTQKNKRKKSPHHKFISWMESKAKSKNANWLLALLAFSDASFFLIPPDILILPLTALRPKKWFFYASIAALVSVMGGIAGYFIGFYLFDTVGVWLLNTYGLHEEFVLVGEQFSSNAFASIFIAAFTPIPYKVFTISAGFFSVSFTTFFVASLLGRSLRYYALAFIVYYFGENAKAFIKKYFNYITIVLVVVLVVFSILFVRW